MNRKLIFTAGHEINNSFLYIMLNTFLENRKPLTALDLKNHASPPPEHTLSPIGYLTHRMKSYPVSSTKKLKIPN